MLRVLAFCFLGLLSALFSPTHALTFKIATLAPDGTNWMKQMRMGAEEIEKRTDKRVKFRFFPGGVMGNDKSVLRKIKVGQLHGGALTGGGLSDIAPDSQIYSLPLSFRSLNEVDYVRQRMDSLLIDDLYDKGFISFGISEGGFAYLMSNKALKKAKDLTGQKVWSPEGDVISRAVFESINVSPILLPLSDVLTGLQTGLIDTVAASTTGAIALQWHTEVKYLTKMPLMYLYGTLLVKRKTYEKLSEQDQTTVREVMQGVFRILNEQNRLDNQSALEALNTQGITFVDTTQQDKQFWENVSTEAMDRLANEGVFSTKMLNILRKHLEEYRQSILK